MERKQRDFWIEVKRDMSHRYLSGDQSEVQNMRLEMTVLAGLITYEPAVVNPITDK